MADVERFVDTASSGGDGTTRNHSGATAAYASASSWEANEATDLSAATGSSQTHRVRLAGSTADTTALVNNGWTVDSTYFVTMEGDDAATDSDGAHNGNWSTSFYRLIVNNDYVINNTTDFMVYKNFQVNLTGTFARSILYNVGVNSQTIEGMIIRMDNTSASARGILNSSVTGTWKISNNYIHAAGSGGAGTGVNLSSAGITAYFYYNMIEGFATAFAAAFQTAQVIDCIFQNNTTDTSSTLGTSSDYNLTDQATFPVGSNNVTSTSLTFVDAANYDFHLAAGDTAAHAGTPLHADPNYPISVDIDGDTRDTTTPWIGPDEYVSAGGTTLQSSLMLMGVGI